LLAPQVAYYLKPPAEFPELIGLERIFKSETLQCTCRTIEGAIQEVKGFLSSHGSVVFILEPGDGTHYEFVIILQELGFIIGQLTGGAGYLFRVGECGTVPSYVHEKAPEMNFWVVYLLCEILEKLTLKPTGCHYYDFEHGTLIPQHKEKY